MLLICNRYIGVHIVIFRIPGRAFLQKKMVPQIVFLSRKNYSILRASRAPRVRAVHSPKKTYLRKTTWEIKKMSHLVPPATGPRLRAVVVIAA